MPEMPDMKDLPADMPEGMMDEMREQMEKMMDNMPKIPPMCVNEKKCGSSEMI